MEIFVFDVIPKFFVFGFSVDVTIPVSRSSLVILLLLEVSQQQQQQQQQLVFFSFVSTDPFKVILFSVQVPETSKMDVFRSPKFLPKYHFLFPYFFQNAKSEFFIEKFSV